MGYILVVEDELFLARTLKDNLEAAGYRVSVALDGEEAIEQVKQEKPDLILLDLVLPKRDGFAVLEQMLKNPEWKMIPIIVLSNLGGEDDIERAKELGAQEYFIKAHSSIDEVIQKIKEKLREIKNQKE